MSEMIKDQETLSEQGNAGRRRLVRGAVAFAPLVLTLRSGALAAASCTGVKIASVQVKNGNPQAGQIMNPPKPLEASDRCVQQGVLQGCPAPHQDKVLTSSPITDANTVQVQHRSGGGPDGYWTCGNEQFQGQTVAILSSQSVTSMGVAPG